ncbi:MAG TPA: hypothetical protein VEU11_03525 [Terriglobales bacterium]|nr:hypothetical protein [Terriglobales bacterium]
MKWLRLFSVLAFLAAAQEPLTNDAIVKMVKGGLGDDVILAMIQNQPGKYSLRPDDLVKLKQQGVSEKVLKAMVNKSPAQTPVTENDLNQSRQKREESARRSLEKMHDAIAGPSAAPASPAAGPAPAASRAANNTFFAVWRDPQENAFQVGVPQGWQVRGGLTRANKIEPHAVIRAESPDGKIHVFYDDPDVHPRQVPDQMTRFAGMREGQTVQGAWGGPVLLARYLTGSQFSQQYIAARMCRQPVITGADELRDATAQMNAVVRPYAAQQRSVAAASVGEAMFRCGSSTGYVMANTLYVKAAFGPSVTMWFVYQLGGFEVSDPEQEGLAYYVWNTMLETLKMNPQWEAQFNREVQDVTGAVTQMQHAMAQSIAQYGQRQASAASAGGFNHPNSGQLPTDLRKKWAGEDAVRQKYSDATLGQQWMHSSTGTNVRVSNSATNWWKDPSGNVVAGPESGGPPPGSQGQYEKLQPGWQ